MDPMTLAALASAGGGSVIGAGLGYAGARAQANAMFPEAWAEDMAALEARKRTGSLGLTQAQRGSMQAEHAAMRGGALADAQAHQLRQAAMGSGAWGNARDLLLQDIATQEAQGQMMNQQTQMISAADEAEKTKNEALLREFQMAEASRDAAKKVALANLGADIIGTGAQVGTSVAGSKAMANETEALLNARAAGDVEGAHQAAVNAARMQMTMQVSGAFGSSAPQLPGVVEMTLNPEPLAPPVPFTYPPPVMPELSDMEALQRNFYGGYRLY
jgi:hypothetical protein